MIFINKKTSEIMNFGEGIINLDKLGCKNVAELLESDWEEVEPDEEKCKPYRAIVEIKGPKMEVQTFLDRCQAAEYMADYDDSKITILTEGEA